MYAEIMDNFVSGLSKNYQYCKVKIKNNSSVTYNTFLTYARPFNYFSDSRVTEGRLISVQIKYANY